MFGGISALLALILLTVFFGCFFHARPAAALPNRLDEEKFAGVPAPTALDFTANGRMLFTSKPGQLYVVDGEARPEALDLGPNVCSNSQRGLLGAAFDPDAAGTSFRINDIGGRSWEEIDRAGRRRLRLGPLLGSLRHPLPRRHGVC